MPVVRRIDEIVTLLERFALGEIHVSKKRVLAAIKLLDLGISDELPPLDPEEAPLDDAADQTVLIFPSRLAA
jgi:hypothetical protein